MNEKLYDGQLVTVGDFSIQGKISKHQWDIFYDSIKDDPVKRDNAVSEFENHFAEKLE